MGENVFCDITALFNHGCSFYHQNDDKNTIKTRVPLQKKEHVLGAFWFRKQRFYILGIFGGIKAFHQSDDW